MKKITSISPEQESKIPYYVEKWLNMEFDNDATIESINNMYKSMGYDIPIIIIGDSPVSIILMNQIMMKLRSQLDSQLYLQLDSQLYLQLNSQLYSQLDSQLYLQLDLQLYLQLRSQLYSQLYSQLDSSFLTNYYPLFWRRSWAIYYEYARYIGIEFNKEEYNIFINFIRHVHCIIPYKNIVFVSKPPKKIFWENKRLHNPTGKSVEYLDGFGLYSWKGISVPEKYITNPDSITKEDFINESNVERRRCLVEILGGERVSKLLGLEEIDKDIVGKTEATTFKTKEKDNLLDDYLYFLKFICPSTGRIYIHSIPKERASNVWRAVAGRWGKTPEQYKLIKET